MSVRHYVIRPARAGDLLAVIARLQECALSTTDLTMSSLANFHIAETDDKLVAGVAGIDRKGSKALLRSIAVGPQWRRSGLGQRLVAQCETAALIAGVNDIYLLTATAIDFFHRLGYQDLSPTVVPAEIARHSQFFNPHPASARCLGKRL